MEIVKNFVPRMTGEDFADKNNLTMTVNERDSETLKLPWINENSVYYASFNDCDILEDRCILRGAFGNGSTPTEAINNYFKEISEKTIVIRPLNSERRELKVPRLIIVDIRDD